MKKNLVTLAIFAALVVVDIWAVEGNPKVPAEIGVRIRNVQLDISRIQNQVLQLQTQYNADQATLTHDQGEMDSLKKEALAAAKLDPAGWNVDEEKLEFVAKPKPAAAPEKK
jgi:hypothetical protein